MRGRGNRGLLRGVVAGAWAAVALWCAPAPVRGDASAEPPATDYTIHVRLDTQTKRLHGSQVLRYTNHSPDAIPDLQFHLYLNAFKNGRSTFMRESAGTLRADAMPKDGWGWIDVRRLAVGGVELTDVLEFIQPDGTDPEDQSVARVVLPTPLAPGATAIIEIDFEAKLPKMFARTGYHDDYYLVAQWFPKIGVWETAARRGGDTPGWNCHQFHATTEFYADFGRYEVHLTVPKHFIVGATGVKRGRTDNRDQATYVFTQDRVIDFAWAASPRFLPQVRTFDAANSVTDDELAQVMQLHSISRAEAELPDVTMILLLQPEHRPQAERYFQALSTAIKHYGLRYGPYPYPQITVVDPAWNARGSSGMEYPMFITGRTDRHAPPDARSGFLGGPSGPEVVTIHEFAHQYWQSIVATNEFEEPWLDEGFNTYTTGRILDETYGPSVQYAGVNGLPVPLGRWLDFAPLSQRQVFRLGVIANQGQDQIARDAWQFRSMESYAINSYTRTGAMLRQLQLEVGDDVMARIMRTYYQRWKFRHPTTRDFIALAKEVADRDLDPFFAALLYSPGTIDLAVTKAASTRIGFEAGAYDEAGGRVVLSREVARKRQRKADKQDEPGMYRTVVEITNHGDLHHPADVLVQFTDGETVRQRWDGAYRWVRYTYERDAKLDRVIVDPDHQIFVDVNRANNSFVAEPERPAGLRWGVKVLLLMQHALLGLGSLTG